MKKSNISRKIATTMAAITVLTTTGCSTYTGEDIASYPLTSMVTQQEAIDYYANSLDYDSVISKNVTVHKTEYELKDIDGAKAETLKSLLAEVETILGNDIYEVDNKSSKLVSEDIYNYIKASIDGLVLDNGKVTNIQGALGYYFVDVEYEVTAQNAGTFKDTVDMLGLNGTWIPSAIKGYEIDFAYIQTAVARLNDYFDDNLIDKKASYNETTGVITISDKGTTVPTLPVPTVPSVNEDEQINNDSQQTDNNDNQSIVNNSQSTSGINNGDTEYYLGSNSVVPSNRKVQLDIALINKVVGSSSNQASYLPELDLVFNKSTASGTISGYGIYPEGSNGLKIFGFNRDDLSGNITLRYIFKDSIDGSGDIIGTNVYIAEHEITNGFNVTSDNVMIPDFLMSEFEQLIERADRVQSNCDLPGLMNGTIYEDKGFAVLRGYKDIYSNQTKYMSKIRQVIARDTTNNAYLLEVETTVVEGAKSSDTFGAYKDRYYVVIQQQGNTFLISDSIKISRELSTEPAIDPDSATAKRLVALNLAGEINSDTKDDIKDLMSALYTAGTNRLLNGPKELTVNGEKVTVEKGMYDCFNSDVTMLTSENKEYMNSKLRSVLIKYGTDTKSVYSGTITEWIGGYENQAEFTTEELVTYAGRSDGYYMQVYYLVSKMNDEWVIDERTVIDEYLVNGTELDNIRSRVGQ